MTRYTREQRINTRCTTHVDPISKSYKDLKDDRVARERLGAGHALATRTNDQVDRGMNNAYHSSASLVSLTTAVQVLLPPPRPSNKEPTKT